MSHLKYIISKQISFDLSLYIYLCDPDNEASRYGYLLCAYHFALLPDLERHYELIHSKDGYAIVCKTHTKRGNLT